MIILEAAPLQNSSCMVTCFFSYKREVKTNSWTFTHGHTSDSQLAKAYIHQFYANTEYHLDDLPRYERMVRESQGNLFC